MKKPIHLLLTVTSLLMGTLTCVAQDTPASMVSIHIASAAPKICTCQMVEIQSRDYTTQVVGIFAEKDNVRTVKNNLRIMDRMIRMEKKHIEKGFSDAVRVLGTYRSDSDCMTLYYNLRRQKKAFRMYQVINVDVMIGTAKR